MTFITRALAIAAVSVAASSTRAAGPEINPYYLTSEIRAEIAVVEAQAATLLADCRDYRDVRRELEDLCYDLDRLQRELSRPIRHEHQLERVARLAQRLDDEACDLQDEIARAVDSMTRNRRSVRVQREVITPVVSRRPVGRTGVSIRLGDGSPRFVFHTSSRSSSRFVGRSRVSRSVNYVASPAYGELQDLRARADRVRALTQHLTHLFCG